MRIVLEVGWIGRYVLCAYICSLLICWGKLGGCTFRDLF